jgi:hypothetical protein
MELRERAELASAVVTVLVWMCGNCFALSRRNGLLLIRRVR